MQRTFSGSVARRIAGAVLLGLTFGGATVGDAAPVRGRLTGYMDLVNPVWAEAKDPGAHSFTFREPSPTVKPEFRRAFPYIAKEVCVALVGTAAQPKIKEVQVKIGGGRTSPVTLVVTPGTEVHFKNTDPFPHRLFGVDVKNFTVGDTQAQGERVWTVPEAGVFEIRDELVPSLRSWVVADPNVAGFGYPDLSGNFSVELPVTGEFNVQVYFAGKVVGTAPTMNITSLQGPIDLSKAPIKLVDKSKAAADQANEEK